MDRYQYVAVMGACLLLTIPLELVLGARVWRQPRRLLVALSPCLVFLVWDLWATARGTWGFADRYTLGVRFPGGMVVEEVLFFTVVPICALLTLEAVRNVGAMAASLRDRSRRA